MEGSLITKFEELERRCKRRRLLRLLGWIAGGVVVVALAGFGYRSLPHSAAKEPDSAAKEPKEMANSKPPAKPKPAAAPKSKAPERKCYGIQVMYAYDSMMEKVFEKKYRALQMGIPCHLRYGKTLENGKKQVYLICATARKKSSLKPAIAKIKRAGWDYVVIRDECRYRVRPKHTKKIAPPPPKEEQLAQIPVVQSESVAQEAGGLVEAKSAGVEELKRLYKNRKSYDLALKIAKSYYAQKSYDQAATWAKRANALDPQRQEAWILYAKSLDALGKRQKAIRILQAYLEFRDSAEAKKLLKSWR